MLTRLLINSLFSHCLLTYELKTGLSCILHAETGSGKTLAYLLPLLKRLINTEKTNAVLPIQSLIIVPTKVFIYSLFTCYQRLSHSTQELAIQVGTEIAMLTMNQNGEDTTSESFSDMVKVCLTNTPKSEVKSIKQPIIVGTPVKVLDLLKNLSPKEVSNINYIVIDEVDKVIHAAGKYASNDEKRIMRTNFKPIEDIMAIILALRSSEEIEKLQGFTHSLTHSLTHSFIHSLASRIFLIYSPSCSRSRVSYRGASVTPRVV